MNSKLPLCIIALAAFAAKAVADEIVLSTGEKLQGTVLERTADTIVMEHPVLGRLNIPVSKLQPAAPPPPLWKFKVEFGASGTSGNVRQSELHAAVGALMEDSERRFKADAGWAVAKVSGTKTKDAKFIEATHDWKLSDPRWSVFATARADWDKFQDWDHRATVGAGVGYLIVDEAAFKLRGRAGLAMTKEWGSSDPDNRRWRPEGLLGAEANWQVNASNALEAKVTYYPDLRDIGEYRAIGSIGWSIKLSTASAMSLKFGVEDEFDSHRSSPFKKNDLRYFAALLWEF